MDSTNSVKIEVRAKPMLSPTRSLDEGFESDPDRVSTDSEQQHLGNKSCNSSVSSVAAAQQFDILQRTDRDGVTHTQITRRFPVDNAATSNQTSLSSPVTTSNAVANSGSPPPDHSSNAAATAQQISLICVSGEIDSCAATGTGATEQTSAIDSATHVPPQKPERTRRSKTKAPQPPATSNSRSHSVDTIRYASDAGDLVIRQIVDTDTINGDVLSGKFVRVQVDPVNQRLDKCSSTSLYSIYPSGSSSLQLWPASSSSNVVKSANRRWNQQQLQQLLYPHQYIRTSGGHSMGSRHHINRISHPVPAPICWTQSIPRQTRR